MLKKVSERVFFVLFFCSFLTLRKSRFFYMVWLTI